MTTEIEDLVSNSKNRDGLARLFDRIAETIAAPLEFKRGGEPTEEVGDDG